MRGSKGRKQEGKTTFTVNSLPEPEMAECEARHIPSGLVSICLKLGNSGGQAMISNKFRSTARNMAHACFEGRIRVSSHEPILITTNGD